MTVSERLVTNGNPDSRSNVTRLQQKPVDSLCCVTVTLMYGRSGCRATEHRVGADRDVRRYHRAKQAGPVRDLALSGFAWVGTATSQHRRTGCASHRQPDPVHATCGQRSSAHGPG
jgi:hypothetical protein